MIYHICQKKREIGEQVLREVYKVFAKSDEDIGDVEGLEMEIRLTDNIPVCVPHSHVLRQLYDEVKNYIMTLSSISGFASLRILVQ